MFDLLEMEDDARRELLQVRQPLCCFRSLPQLQLAASLQTAAVVMINLGCLPASASMQYPKCAAQPVCASHLTDDGAAAGGCGSLVQPLPRHQRVAPGGSAGAEVRNTRGSCCCWDGTKGISGVYQPHVLQPHLLSARAPPPNAACSSPQFSSTRQVADEDDLRAGEPVSLVVQLEREMEGELRPVDAAR